jgi:dTDP-4-amino-4,6-dideoxygalactose transaminase
MIHYPVPPHLSDAMRPRHAPGDFPITEELADTVLSLRWVRMDRRSVERVIAAVLISNLLLVSSNAAAPHL